MKIKLSKNIGLKVGEQRGIEVFDNIFVNLDAKAGTEIEISEKDYKYHLASVKRFLKSQAALEKLMEGN